MLFAVCGLAMALSHGCGLAANVCINYTTAMLFTSARLPTVLLLGPLVARAGNDGGAGRSCAPAAAHLAGACVMLGLLLFGLAESRDSPRFSLAGLGFVAANLVFGAFTFNFQEQVLKGRMRHRTVRALVDASVEEKKLRAERLMVEMYTIGAVLYILIAGATGECAAFAEWARLRGSTPLGALAPVLASAVFTAAGVRALIRVTSELDAARASTITSSRKACTFALSFLIFPKVIARCTRLARPSRWWAPFGYTRCSSV